MSKEYIVLVLNTTTELYEEVSVTEDVYNEFRRGEWRISKNDDKHKANETPFSTLIGGEDNAYENFDEFIDTNNTPEKAMLKELELESLKHALSDLNKAEQALVQALFL